MASLNAGSAIVDGATSSWAGAPVSMPSPLVGAPLAATIASAVVAASVLIAAASVLTSIAPRGTASSLTDDNPSEDRSLECSRRLMPQILCLARLQVLPSLTRHCFLVLHQISWLSLVCQTRCLIFEPAFPYRRNIE